MFGYYAPASVIIFSCKTCLNTSFKLHPSEFFQQVFFSCCAWTGEESRRKTGEVQAKFPTVSHLLFFLLLCALQQDSFISKLPLKNQVSTELRYLYWSWLTPHLNSDALNPAFMEVWAHQLTAIKQKGQLPFLGAGWVFSQMRCEPWVGSSLCCAQVRCCQAWCHQAGGLRLQGELWPLPWDERDETWASVLDGFCTGTAEQDTSLLPSYFRW